MGGAFFGLSGRINATNWLWAQLLCLLLIASAFALEFTGLPQLQNINTLPGGFAFSEVFYFVAFVVNLCSTVKRYHDFGNSGIWYLFIFIPVVGQFLQWRQCARQPGDAGSNAYGPPPNAVEENQNANQSPGKFAKFDEAFFESYKSQTVSAAPTMVATVSTESQKPAFGKRS